MGVNISDLLSKKEIDLSSLRGKTIAVDAHLFLYQFLTTIRQRDGSFLMDSKGKVTSHLSGLFNRNSRLIQQGLNLIYVFDGKVPRPSSQMASNDPRFAPDSIIEHGADSIRRYWNNKNLRRRK